MTLTEELDSIITRLQRETARLRPEALIAPEGRRLAIEALEAFAAAHARLKEGRSLLLQAADRCQAAVIAQGGRHDE